MRYFITFMATGGLDVEADSEEEAIRIFQTTMQTDAMNELESNGIDLTSICKLNEGE